MDVVRARKRRRPKQPQQQQQNDSSNSQKSSGIVCHNPYAKSTTARSSTASAGLGAVDETNDKETIDSRQLQLVYPTSDEICNSIEGYRGGKSVPGELHCCVFTED